MNVIRSPLARLAVACVFGLIVAGITVYVIPAGGSSSYYMTYPQKVTRRHIDINMKDLADYQSEQGTFPTPGTPEAQDSLMWPDAWGRPFRYSLSSGNPLVESLGRDGIRGGVGLDADISNQITHPANEEMPLLQKLTHPLAKGMIVVALICGVMFGGLIFSALSDGALRSASWGVIASSLLIACGMATYGAVIITAFHIPSGH